MFIDELEIYVQAGHGGAGCTSFRREKYVEFGGPDGGNGGDGGHVILKVRPEFNTLLPLRTLRHYRAERGQNGRGSNMTGACGNSLILDVPAGTIVRERETGAILGDLTQEGDEIIVAKGGRGGKGNRHFSSSTLRAPRFSQPGEDGDALWIKLELKMLADVGLVGFPNAGKSTLISRISAAKPKVADYPFTTLKPNLGVVQAGDYGSFVVADIPGIIEGAHDGAGLGLRFLKHIERTSLLLMLIDPSDPERDPYTCYKVLRNELRSFSEKLSRKPIVVALTKEDVPHEQEEPMARLAEELENADIKYLVISSVTGSGIDQLVRYLHERVMEEKSHRPQTPVIEEPEEPSSSDIDPLDEI